MEFYYSLYSPFRVLYCLIISVNALSLPSIPVVVQSPFGKIQGLKKTNENRGQSYLSFQGIPYAKPPVGELRFAKPQPHPVIDGIFDATRDQLIVCPHPDELTLGLSNFTEDCLVLNIHFKNDTKKNDSLQKVIVYIHGGGFHFGVGLIHDPTSFVTSQDVIVVTINYRLGILGFLSTENEASPGNYGLWDQTLAIKWVKDNIRAFGGDPDDITIIGESAGGSSVGFQALSPHTKGLFTKAFPQSGTATSAFARSINAQSHALRFAQTVGCWNDDINTKIDLQQSRDLVKCLKQVNVSQIASFMPYDDSKTQFVPCVDGDFLPDLPAKLLNNDEYLDSIGFFNRSYVVSIVNNEIGIGENLIKQKKASILMNNKMVLEERRSYADAFDRAVRELQIISRIGKTASKNPYILEKIFDFYGRRTFKEDIAAELTDNLNNLIPSIDLLAAASRRESSPSYFLYFNYYPRFITGPRKGTPHEADLSFWFDLDLQFVEDYVGAGIVPSLWDSDDEEMKHMFSSIIGELARTG